jgi:hypothetical protein
MAKKIKLCKILPEDIEICIIISNNATIWKRKNFSREDYEWNRFIAIKKEAKVKQILILVQTKQQAKKTKRWLLFNLKLIGVVGRDRTIIRRRGVTFWLDTIIKESVEVI